MTQIIKTSIGSAETTGHRGGFRFAAWLLFLGIFVAPARLHAQTPRKLLWSYNYDPPGKRGRTWTHVSPSKWVEVCEGGPTSNFTVVRYPATVDGNRGAMVEREDHALFVFVPDADAHGNHPDWLQVYRKGDTKWSLLGKFHLPVVYTY